MSYILKPKDDELYHWKYIKKVKRPNGKWRYIYDRKQLRDDLGYDELERLKKYKTYKELAERDHEMATELWGLTANIHSREKTKESNAKVYAAMDAWQATLRNAERAGRKYTSARVAYYNTPLGKIDKFDDKIDAGRNKVADILTKAIDKIRPKEEKGK